MTKVLILGRGVVGRDMGSSGIRSYHLARVLAEQLPEAQVTLAVPNVPDIPSPHPRLTIVPYRSQWQNLLLMFRHDIIISRNFPPHVIPFFLRKRLALDFYTSFFFEWIELSRRIPNARRRKIWIDSNRHYINTQLTLADFVVCANERQRDALVGTLSTLGLVTPHVYDRDSTLRRLVNVVPYGVQPGRPEHTRQVLKGVPPSIRPLAEAVPTLWGKTIRETAPSIRADDRLLIWNGAIIEWLDALTVIRAMAKVSSVRDDVKLLFLGTEHPDWVTGLLLDPPKRALELANELGLHGRSVFFNFGWVPYSEIGNYLAEADIGVCAGYTNLENRYAFRTRLVDLFWAELPIVCTRGDVLAARVERDPLGIAVPPGDSDAMATAILRLVDDQQFYQRCRSNLVALKEELSWERTAQPLVEFCRGDKIASAPKWQRLLPLFPRAAQYFITRMRHMRIED